MMLNKNYNNLFCENFMMSLIYKKERTLKLPITMDEIEDQRVKLGTTLIRVITKLPNSEQSYKGKVKTHKYINRQNQSTTGKL
jgi:hypothetical protein